MFTNLRHCRAALAGLSLAALLVGCGGTASTAPSIAGATPGPAATIAPGTGAAATAASGATAAPGAGGDSTGAACTIVTKDAVATAVGFAINSVSGVDSICYFQNADLSKYAVIKLYANQADMADMLQIETGSEHIAGLGDDAFWVPVAGILFVRQGDHAMQISDSEGALTAGSDASLKASLTTLARAALPKL